MKKILLYLSVFAFSAAGLSSCADDYDEYDNSWFLENDETMTLSASVSSLELIEDTPLDEQVLTFTWTPARQMPDEYVVTYVTQLDLKSNNFASSTVIREVENDGVFSKSYTTEQLQSYITDKWGQSIADVSTVSFKVIAKWDGGTQYVMPEVRTVDVDIPDPDLSDRPLHGRVNTIEREAGERKHDFVCIECGLTEQGAMEESSRCLRCDHFGYGIFKGGRKTKW